MASSKRIASPGCYASGFIALVKPLLDEGIVSPDHGFICHAVSGYSGAGKKVSLCMKATRKHRSFLLHVNTL